MTIQLADALRVRTSDGVLSDLFAALATKNIDATGWADPSVHRALVELQSIDQAKEEELRATIVQGGFLDTAALTGDAWLDLLAKGFFYIDRMPATKAVGTMRLSNAKNVGPYQLDAQKLIATNPAGQLYRNTSAGTLLPGPGTFVDLTWAADKPGTQGNLPANSPVQLVTGIPGVTISNLPLGTTGTWLLQAGVDAEGNDSLIARCRGRWGDSSYGGNRDAYVVRVARAFIDRGFTSTITRIKVDDTNPNGPGSVDVYLANAAGAASSEELAIVAPYLITRQGLGSGPLRILPANVLVLAVAGTLYAAGAMDPLGAATAALVALEATFPLGGRLYVAELIQRLMNVAGAFNVGLSSPLADVQLQPNQVLVIAPTITLG